ncbi:MAG: hypothetical protein ABI960_00245 [Candidatus Eisenbacteria bacterium]
MSEFAPPHRQVVAERRIRIAASLVLVGMVIEVVSLNILHPLSFLLFLGVGGLTAAVGIAWFLLALLKAGE